MDVGSEKTSTCAAVMKSVASISCDFYVPGVACLCSGRYLSNNSSLPEAVTCSRSPVHKSQVRSTIPKLNVGCQTGNSRWWLLAASRLTHGCCVSQVAVICHWYDRPPPPRTVGRIGILARHDMFASFSAPPPPFAQP